MFNSIMWLVIGLVSGGLISFFVRKVIINHKTRVAETKMAQLLSETKDRSKEILLTAKEEAVSIRLGAEADFKDRRSELQRWEKRLSHREDGIDRKSDNVEKREKDAVQREKEVEGIKEQANKTLQEQMLQLELISGMSHAEAKDPPPDGRPSAGAVGGVKAYHTAASADPARAAVQAIELPQLRGVRFHRDVCLRLPGSAAAAGNDFGTAVPD